MLALIIVVCLVAITSLGTAPSGSFSNTAASLAS
jgi:hypothetical protein